MALTGVAGYILLAPKSASSKNGEATFEVIAPIDPSLDGGHLSEILDPSKLKDFSVPVDLTHLGNTTLFGPLQ